MYNLIHNELEEVTEKLSEMVARPYLRTPRPVIVQTTALARRKRHEFVRAVSKGLIPPETPPTLRKVRKRRFPGLMGMDPVDDEQISHAIAASLKDLDSSNPWVKDAQGCHTNLSALYDWPDFDSDEEESEVNRALAVSLLGECSRAGCTRPRARNPRTSAIHDYCSLRCSRSVRVGTNEDVYRVNVTADYNMDLVIALEMSRLQMIEDEMKKRQKAEEASKVQSSTLPASSVGVMDDQQLKLAIQLSLQESTKRVALLQSSLAAGKFKDPELPKAEVPKTHKVEVRDGDEENSASISAYHRTSADLTVDYFLKSLAGRQLDMKNLNSGGVNVFSPEETSGPGEVVWGCGLSKTLADKELIGFKPGMAEDGRFEIGDIHENGCFNDPDDYDEADARLLKRSHSTGDLCTRGRQGHCSSGTASGDEPRYHLDSDHSSQHEEKPEDIVKRILALPASSRGMSGRQFLLLHHHSGGSNSNAGGELSTTTSDDGASIYYGGQSSVEDTTTTSDSLNADLEVCGILGTTTEDDEEGKSLMDDDIITARSMKTFPRVFHKSALAINDTKNYMCGFDELKQAYNKDNHIQNDQAVNVSSTASSHVLTSEKSTFSNSLLEAHRKAFKAAGGKAVGSGGLRIRICKSPSGGPEDGSKHNCHHLETDSSNEYESETGIPKSPTLYISGVSISRTPEPRSPAVIAATVVSAVGRQSRSSSLTVPPPAPSLAPTITTTVLGSSSISLNTAVSVLASSPDLVVRSCTPIIVSCSSMVITPPPLPLMSCPNSPVGMVTPRSAATSPILTPSNGNTVNTASSTKSKSASEPEREREMFRFPKSSTDGALSSVLHVQESNLSSDDFHEALFLLERSPKGSGSSKRRKKSKKERHKDKENNNFSSGKTKELKEASSVL